MSWSHLSPEEMERAEQLYHQLRQRHDDKLRELAALLASKPERELLGKTEFEVRDLVHEIGADAIQAAVSQRKKGGT